MSRRILPQTLSLSLCGALAACGGVESDTTPEPIDYEVQIAAQGAAQPWEGKILVELVCRPNADLPGAVLVVDNIWMRFDGQKPGWMDMADGAQKLELDDCKKGRSLTLAMKPIPEGHYGPMRIVASSGWIEADGRQYPMVVPAELQEGLKLDVVFDAKVDRVAHVVLSLDVQRGLQKIDTGVYGIEAAAFGVVSVEVD